MFNPQPKEKTYRSKKYRGFIRSLPCVICGGNSIIHHEPLGRSGKGIKCPDSHGIPLCSYHHAIRHQEGAITFWGGYNVEMLIIGYLTAYLKKEGL